MEDTLVDAISVEDISVEDIPVKDISVEYNSVEDVSYRNTKKPIDIIYTKDVDLTLCVNNH